MFLFCIIVCIYELLLVSGQSVSIARHGNKQQEWLLYVSVMTSVVQFQLTCWLHKQVVSSEWWCNERCLNWSLVSCYLLYLSVAVMTSVLWLWHVCVCVSGSCGWLKLFMNLTYVRTSYNTTSMQNVKAVCAMLKAWVKRCRHYMVLCMFILCTLFVI